MASAVTRTSRGLRSFYPVGTQGAEHLEKGGVIYVRKMEVLRAVLRVKSDQYTAVPDEVTRHEISSCFRKMCIAVGLGGCSTRTFFDLLLNNGHLLL